MTDGTAASYARALGERLRKVRHQQGMTLLSVEEASGREFKATVLGAYERGGRIISVPRLQRLAHLYGVPVERLLPDAGPATPRPAPLQPVRVGLSLLAVVDSPEGDVLRRYVHAIENQRGDFNGRVITIRDEDVRALAWIFDSDESSMRARLRELSWVNGPPTSQ